MSRRDDREQSLSLLFELSFCNMPDDIEKAVADIAAGREEQLSEFAARLVPAIFEKKSQIDEVVAEFSQKWSSERISRVSRAVLDIAIYEMLFDDSISHAVAINEAVVLAKKFEGKEASAFINGILGAVSKKFPEQVGNDV